MELVVHLGVPLQLSSGSYQLHAMEDPVQLGLIINSGQIRQNMYIEKSATQRAGVPTTANSLHCLP